ncbi:hypothetical protein PPTG_17611 [Phytophthora nicotianae INRA-310]|uniref:Uncharacterized protein n=1 Tax=Phytophthora nicotianae (strain INRA-310) TaxID=761204 RepID=W2PLR4_PHYN3|nr:hypothetical protein PPTG_17611 [Phytophthora nicotianae INRA-310]ETN01199.1 hypothetical protein PPTG_17611 [Phytophthora nicotianae INRA-310]
MVETAQQEQEGEEEEMETEDLPTVKSMASNFFDDLPVGAKLMDTQVPPNVSPPKSKTKDGYSFFTYAARRRNEDSAGRLKAQHKRQIGTCALESTWQRASEQNEGSHDHKVSSGTVETFEQAWKRTSSDVAEDQAKAHGAKQSVLPDQPPAQELP